jgi:hypothetical protein
MEAQGGKKKDKLIFDACYAILFFGVPHKGLNQKDFMEIVKGQPNSILVGDLDPGSQFLRDMQDHFYDRFNRQDVSVYSFYETESTKAVEVLLRKHVIVRLCKLTILQRDSITGAYARTGPKKLMVSMVSATRPVPWEKASHQIPINEDHSNIVKFGSRSSPHYLTVSRKIRNLVDEAPPAMPESEGDQGTLATLPSKDKESKVIPNRVQLTDRRKWREPRESTWTFRERQVPPEYRQ